MKVLLIVANQKGQSLIEAVATLGIILLILTGIITATTYSIRNSNYAKTQSQATKYATELTEWFRSQRDDQDWATFLARTNTYCFNDVSIEWPIITGACSVSDYSLESKYKREATLTRASASAVTINITVSWQDESGIHQSNLETYLTQW